MVPCLPKRNILAEPVGRNTAAAVGLAAVALSARDPDAVMAILPADHHVADEPAFRAVVGQALAIAEAHDALVTVGIRPTKPDTGFGYLERGTLDPGGASSVLRFVEKPDRATAEAYLATGRFLWNSGMFFFSARRILTELGRHLPETRAALAEIAAAFARDEETAARVLADIYPKLPSVSIDTGVMERASGIVTLVGDFGWNDVGSFAALAELRPADAQGNVCVGDVVTVDARRNVTLADEGTLVALLGVEDLIVVRSGNAVLVAPRSHAQDVRDIVSELESRGLTTYL